MNPDPEHLVIAPIVVPLVAGAMLLFFDDRRRWLKAAVSVAVAVVLLAVSISLLRVAHAGDGRVAVYLLGNWPPPFAIVLVLDRLSAMMLALTAALAIPALIFSLARWHKAGAHFHTLFLFLLMGLNGAFLTGDLFNLFVFFEVMLAASYGLVLHGSGPFRVTAGMHYIAMNLAASLLFLIGVSLIYGVTGTLNMADLAQHIPKVAEENRMMLEAGAAILGVAFLMKAGMWPLCFWLPSAYAAAAAPVAATFAIMSKVGIYVLLRLSLLFFGERAGPSAGFGSEVLLFGGMATIAFGAIGVLASRRLGQIAGFSVLVSSGTLLASISLSQTGVTAGALFYLVSSTLTMGAFFLLIELIERGQEAGANVFAVTAEAYDEREEADEEDEDVGIALSRHDCRAGHQLCRLRHPARRVAAAFRLRRQVRDPLGHAQPRGAWKGRGDLAGIVVACSAHHPVGPVCPDRHEPRGHPRLLGAGRTVAAARAPRRDGAGGHPARPYPRVYAGSGTGDALHGSHGGQPALPDCLCGQSDGGAARPLRGRRPPNEPSISLSAAHRLADRDVAAAEQPLARPVHRRNGCSARGCAGNGCPSPSQTENQAVEPAAQAGRGRPLRHCPLQHRSRMADLA